MNILALTGPETVANIEPHPSPGARTAERLALQGFQVSQPLGGSLSALAAVIGGWDRPDPPMSPAQLLEAAADYLVKTEREGLASIRLPPTWQASPSLMLRALNTGLTIRDIASSPRALIQDEEALLYAMGGALLEELIVYDVQGDAVVRFPVEGANGPNIHCLVHFLIVPAAKK